MTFTSTKIAAIIGGLLSLLVLFLGVLAAINVQEYTIIVGGLVVVLFTMVLFCMLGLLLDLVRYFIVRYTPSKVQTAFLVVAMPLTVSSYCFILLSLMSPSVQYSREAARCVRCRNNMTQIGIALQNYHDHHGSFPPAYTVDDEGNPLHSWRTLILPYFAPGTIEQRWKDMYDKIRFDEPWDSEYNVQLNEHVSRIVEAGRVEQPPDYEGPREFHSMPSVYGCPGYSGDNEMDTVYKMIVGKNAIGNSRGYSKAQITRPLNKTILLVETGLSVPWMCPTDFAVEDFKTVLYGNNREMICEIESAKLRTVRTCWHNLGEHYKDCERCFPNGEFDDLAALAKRQFFYIHFRELHLLFADGTVKTYWDWKLPLAEIEAMSRIREKP